MNEEQQESTPLLLRLLEDILYNRIKQKKQEIQRTHNELVLIIYGLRDRNTSMDFSRVLISEGGSRYNVSSNKIERPLYASTESVPFAICASAVITCSGRAIAKFTV
jgi:hypothetical protein